MKKLLFLLLLVATLVACKDDPEPFRLDPDAMILLRGDGNTAKEFVNGLTPLEIVEHAVNIKWQSHYFGNDYYETPYDIARTFAEADRDFETPALLMWGTDIISQEGEYYRDFIYGFNVYITDNNNDTIAHVPDEVIDNARVLIETAYEGEDYEEVYRIFNEAFTFQPLPGK